MQRHSPSLNHARCHFREWGGKENSVGTTSMAYLAAGCYNGMGDLDENEVRVALYWKARDNAY